jgi:hypothetical protein
MAEIAFRYRVRRYKAADIGTMIDAANEVAQRIRRDLPMADVQFLDLTKSDNVLVMATAADVRNPAAATKNADGTSIWRRLSGAGGAAGNHTVTGVATTDTLIAVLHSNDTTHAVTDLTSEYTISATNTINNTSGTTSVGSTLIVVTLIPPLGANIAAAAV